MEELNQATKLINQSDNILVIGPKDPGLDELGSAFSLSYTLNKSGKIVNHCLENPGTLPQVFEPIVSPRTFIITIKSDDISQLYYEKQQKLLKIFVTTKEKFVDKKDIDISPVKNPQLKDCDLIITIGLENLEQLNSLYDENFKTFYQTPILNIDSKESNSRFGNHNFVDHEQPIAVTLNRLIRSANYKLDKNTKFWLLLGIIDFLKKKEPNRTTLETVFKLINIEIDFDKLILPLYKEQSAKLLVQAFKTMTFYKDIAVVALKKEHFKKTNTNNTDLRFILEKLTKETFRFPKLLVLWQNTPFVKGVLYSKDKDLLNKIKGQKKGNGVIFTTQFKNIGEAKEKIKKLL